MGSTIERGIKPPVVFLIVLFSIFSAYTAASSVSAPHISEAYVNPLKVRPGDTMTVTAKIEDDYGVALVTADMGGIEIIELELIEGTVYSGVWQKQWLVHDTEVRDYNTTITATNILGLKTTINVEWTDPDPPLILFWDGGQVPNGWTCISCNPGDPFFERFLRGNATYGGTGGSSAHTHTVSGDTSSGPTGTNTVSGAGTVASDTHVHTYSSGSTSSVSTLPRYRGLKVIAYDNGIPSIIPAGAIAIFNDTLPANWIVYTLQDGYFLMGNVSVTTGGTNSHNHSVSIQTNDVNEGGGGENSGFLWAKKKHKHYGSGETESADNRPPFINVTFANATVDTTIPAGLIGIFNATPPSGWISMSGPGGDFEDRFVVGSTAYGPTGGSTSHSYSNLTITTGSASATVDEEIGAGGVGATSSHTHTINVSFDSSSNLPPYINVIFAYVVNLPTSIISNPQFNESAVAPNDEVQFTVEVTSNEGVGTVITTFQKPDLSKVNQTLSLLSGDTYYYNWTDTSATGTYNVTYVWVNNSAGNVTAQTYSDVSFLVDSTPPTYSNINTDNTEAGLSTNFSVHWQDNAGLSGYIFSWNNSGTWVNDTFTNMTGSTNQSDIIKTLNNTAGVDVGWRIYANDTANNWNDTGIQILTTTDETPPLLFSLQPLLGIYSGTIDIKASVTDASLDAKYWWWENGTDTGTNQTLNGTLDTATLVDGSYTIRYWANDTLGNVNATESITITVDNYSPPSVFALQPTAGIYSGTIDIKASVTDASLDAKYWWWENGTDTGTNQTLNGTLDTATLVDGSYTIRYWASDTLGNVNATESITITVDNNAPSISSPSDITVTEGNEKSITWTITETNGGRYYILRNNSVVTSSASYTSGVQIIQSINTATTGDWNYTIIANDTAENTVQDDVIVTISPASSTPPSGGGGGGGGGGGATDFEVLIRDIQAGESFDLDIDDENIQYIFGLSLDTIQDIYSSRFSITDIGKKPWPGMKDPDGIVYRYFKVSYNKNNLVSSAKFRFTVIGTWLKNNDIDPFKVSLYRYTNDWEKLDTEILNGDDERIYYEATTPGFSYFAVAGLVGSGYRPIKKEETVPITTAPPATNESTPSVPSTSDPYISLSPSIAPVEEDKLPFDKILPILFTIMAAVSATYVYHYQKKKPKLVFWKTKESEEHVIEVQREYISRVTNVLKEVIEEPEDFSFMEKVPAIKELLGEGAIITESKPSVIGLQYTMRKVAKDYTEGGPLSLDEVRNEIRRIAKEKKEAT